MAWLVLVAGLLAGFPFRAQAGKRAPDLKAGSPEEVLEVIVRYRRQPAEQHRSKLVAHGGTVKISVPLVNALAASIPARALPSLEADPEVEYITPDRPVRAALDYAAPAVNAALAWEYGFNGAGIGIAVIDGGIANHLALADPSTARPRVVYEESFVAGKPADNYGHGTHVAGILGGNGRSSTGYPYRVTFRGIAPAAHLINLRVLDETGLGQGSGVIAAIQRAIELKGCYNIRVLNLSLGRPIYESYRQDPLCRAAEAAWRAGLVVVAAAGNDGRDNSSGNEGYATITSPGNDPFVITVGAMRTMGTPTRGDDLIASYSSKGPTLIDHIVKPDLVAPGNRRHRGAQSEVDGNPCESEQARRRGRKHVSAEDRHGIQSLGMGRQHMLARGGIEQEIAGVPEYPGEDHGGQGQTGGSPGQHRQPACERRRRHSSTAAAPASDLGSLPRVSVSIMASPKPSSQPPARPTATEPRVRGSLRRIRSLIGCPRLRASPRSPRSIPVR